MGFVYAGEFIKAIEVISSGEAPMPPQELCGVCGAQDLTSKQDAILFVVSMTLIFSVPIGLSLFAIIADDLSELNARAERFLIALLPLTSRLDSEMLEEFPIYRSSGRNNTL